MTRKRITVEIEDDHLRTIMNRYGIPTKTDAVNFALRHLAGEPMTRAEALRMRGAHAIDVVPTDVGARAIGDSLSTFSATDPTEASATG